MENSKRKSSGKSRIALDYDLNAKIKSWALKMSKPGARVTIENIVTEAVKKWLAEHK